MQPVLCGGVHSLVSTSWVKRQSCILTLWAIYPVCSHACPPMIQGDREICHPMRPNFGVWFTRTTAVFKNRTGCSTSILYPFCATTALSDYFVVQRGGGVIMKCQDSWFLFGWAWIVDRTLGHPGGHEAWNPAVQICGDRIQCVTVVCFMHFTDAQLFCNPVRSGASFFWLCLSQIVRLCNHVMYPWPMMLFML
jgi:hypothetical protein